MRNGLVILPRREIASSSLPLWMVGRLVIIEHIQTILLA